MRKIPTPSRMSIPDWVSNQFRNIEMTTPTIGPIPTALAKGVFNQGKDIVNWARDIPQKVPSIISDYKEGLGRGENFWDVDKRVADKYGMGKPLSKEEMMHVAIGATTSPIGGNVFNAPLAKAMGQQRATEVASKSVPNTQRAMQLPKVAQPPKVGEVEKTIRSKADPILSKYKAKDYIDDVYLVGSRAKGTNKATSDFDVVVKVKNFQDIAKNQTERNAFFNLEGELDEALKGIKVGDRKVDVFVTDEITGKAIPLKSVAQPPKLLEGNKILQEYKSNNKRVPFEVKELIKGNNNFIKTTIDPQKLDIHPVKEFRLSGGGDAQRIEEVLKIGKSGKLMPIIMDGDEIIDGYTRAAAAKELNIPLEAYVAQPPKGDIKLYHGTSRGNIFDKFEIKKERVGVGSNALHQGDAVYLTDSKEAADYFSKQATRNAKLRNPKLTLEEQTGGPDISGEIYEVSLKKGAKVKQLNTRPSLEQVNKLRSEGYDAISFPEEAFGSIEGSPINKIKSNTFVVFDPSMASITPQPPKGDIGGVTLETYKISPKTIELRNIEVPKSLRGQGIGRQKIAEIFNNNPDVEKIVGMSLPESESFFRKLGARFIDRKGGRFHLDKESFNISTQPPKGGK